MDVLLLSADLPIGRINMMPANYFSKNLKTKSLLFICRLCVYFESSQCGDFYAKNKKIKTNEQKFYFCCAEICCSTYAICILLECSIPYIITIFALQCFLFFYYMVYLYLLFSRITRDVNIQYSPAFFKSRAEEL